MHLLLSPKSKLLTYSFTKKFGSQCSAKYGHQSGETQQKNVEATDQEHSNYLYKLFLYCQKLAFLISLCNKKSSYQRTYVLAMSLIEKIYLKSVILDQSPIIPVGLQFTSSAHRTFLGKRCFHSSWRLGLQVLCALLSQNQAGHQ